MQAITDLLATPIWYSYLLRIVLFYGIARCVQLASVPLAKHFFRIRLMVLDHNRRQTLQGLLASVISFIAYGLATLSIGALFIDVDTLLWMVGLCSAAFGLSVRSIVSDWLTGITLMFDDSFRVGDKIVIAGVEGVVETVTLRNTEMRSNFGELFIVPNGEIRVVRNFSRSDYSIVKVRLNVKPTDSGRAADLLDGYSTEAVAQLPNLIAPWQVLGDGEDGSELAIVAKSRYGHAAELRPRMLELAHEYLEKNAIAFDE